MLRSVYRGLLWLHPPYFRERFGDEMLSIYDQAAGRMAAGKLVGDALVSLVRQWVLRPAYWQDPVKSERFPFVSAGIPSFFTFEHSRPSNAVLFHATTATSIVFLIISLAIVRSKPSTLKLYVPSIQFEEFSSASSSEESGNSSSQPHAPSVEQAPERSTSRREQWQTVKPSSKSARASDNQATPSAPVSPPTRPPGTIISSARGANPRDPIDLKSPTSLTAGPRRIVSTHAVAWSFESYTGVYVAEAPESFTAHISLEDGRLFVEIPGQKKTGLTAYSETLFIAPQPHCRRIVFSEYDEGKFHRLELDCGGHPISALRRPDQQQVP